MIKKILITITLFFLSSCGRVYIHSSNESALKDSENIAFGRIKVYELPRHDAKQKIFREISHLCYIDDIKLNKSPFYKWKFIMPDRKKYIKFFNHGLFAASTEQNKIEKIHCKKSKSTIRTVHNIDLKITDIKRNKLNYLGDINIYLYDDYDGLRSRTTKVCSTATYACSTHTNRNYFVTPKKISVKNNMKKTYKDIKKDIQLPLNEEHLIFNKIKQGKNAKTLFSEDKSSLPF